VPLKLTRWLIGQPPEARRAGPPLDAVGGLLFTLDLLEEPPPAGNREND
jgi:hypothetical protein